MPSGRTRAVGCLVVLAIWSMALGGLGDLAGAEKANSRTYAPVAPRSAVEQVARANLEVIRGWLADKDFASAAETTQGLIGLTELLEHRLSAGQWKDQTKVLREASHRLASAAKNKDAADADKAAKECEDALAVLARLPIEEDRLALRDFRPYGVKKTWMLLMDGVYQDAKAAKTGREIENLAYFLAEGGNVVAHFEDQAEWRKGAGEMSAAALELAKQARTLDAAAAKTALKGVYQRCERCHAVFK